MVKALDALNKKLADIQFDRIESGKATKFEKAEFKFWENFVEKHPKITKFVVDHKDEIDVVCDIAFAVFLAKAAYNMGQVNLAKDFDNWKTLGMGAAVDGKKLQVQSLVTTPKGLTGTVANSTTNPADMMDIANKAIEALANNGVTFSAF